MRVLLVGIAFFFLFSCSKPAPPTLVPKKASVTSISPAGMGIELTLLATNPNSVDITAGDVQANVLLDKTIEVGATTVAEQVTLPAKQTTEIKVAASLPWQDLVPLMSLAMSDRHLIPYKIDGTLRLGGDLVAIQVPFTMEGNVTREQIARATANSIPGLGSVTSPSTNPDAPAVPAIPIHRVPPHTHR